MQRLEVRPFADEHLDDAARLLAQRHRRHRAAEPLLPERVDFRAEIAALLDGDDASGTVALRDGRVIGYLVGVRREDDVWGPNVWIDFAGHAANDAEVVRDLYALAAERWLNEGRNRHFVLVPPADAGLVDAWFRLSFGQQQAHGVREVPDEPWPESARRAEPRDVDAILEMAPLLNLHQTLSPVFSTRRSDDVDELRAEIESDVASDEMGNVVAEVDGRIVGNFEVVPVELSSMHHGLGRPERACYLGFAVTLPEFRGSGAGLALTQASFAWAHEAGYETMVTDWRVTNLLSSRFWPRRGFRTSFIRLYRPVP